MGICQSQKPLPKDAIPEMVKEVKAIGRKKSLKQVKEACEKFIDKWSY